MISARRTSEAKARVLTQYRIFRQRGYAPELAMYLVQITTKALADTGLDEILPPRVSTDGALDHFFSIRYGKIIHQRVNRSPFWRLGFTPVTTPNMVDWDE